MNKTLGLLIMIPLVATAEDGLNILKSKGTSDLNLSKNIQVQKQLSLTDSFQVQAYGHLRSNHIIDQNILSVYDLVFDNKFEKAFELIHQLEVADSPAKKLIDATKLYLLWQLGYYHSFTQKWLEEANKYNFLNTELGVALDQVLGEKLSDWMIDNAVIIPRKQFHLAKNISEVDSKFNYTVQAFTHLRQGGDSLARIKYLGVKDPLRAKLSESVLLSLAKKGHLADAAKVLKEVVLPALDYETDTEQVARYYMTLARLLYQAKAFDASKHYYKLIPDESKYFLQARTEILWIDLQQGNLGSAKGSVVSLESNLFSEKFIPEVHLVSAMTALYLCQFEKVANVFNRFIEVNKLHAKKIQTNLAAANPIPVDQDAFFVKQYTRSLALMNNEITSLEKFGDITAQLRAKIKSNILEIQKERKQEILRQWNNRYALLSLSIKNMRFVKVEYLSKMRRLNSQLARSTTSDRVSTKASAIGKKGEMVFPHDGIMFADEVFHINAKVKKLCHKGHRND